MTFSVVLDGNDSHQFLPKIKVIGVGGAGNNAISNMIKCSLTGVDFIVANTDAQTLDRSPCDYKIQLGGILTSGLGAGTVPMVGRNAAEESRSEIEKAIDGAHVVFIAAGMGGGTGTGAAPVVAEIAKSKGILSIGVVTKPFLFEGSERMRVANEGIKELEKYIDTLIVVSNQNLFRISNERTALTDAFQEADNILYSGVKSITDLFIKPGLINLDLADVKSIISTKGIAMLGSGEASGPNRALEAVEIAMRNPLLEDVNLRSAKGLLLNIASGSSLTLFEFEKIASFVKDAIDSEETKFICGSTIDDELDDKIRVSIIATGISKGLPKSTTIKIESVDTVSSIPSGDRSSGNDDGYDDSFFEDMEDEGDISEFSASRVDPASFRDSSASNDFDNSDFGVLFQSDVSNEDEVFFEVPADIGGWLPGEAYLSSIGARVNVKREYHGTDANASVHNAQSHVDDAVLAFVPEEDVLDSGQSNHEYNLYADGFGNQEVDSDSSDTAIGDLDEVDLGVGDDGHYTGSDSVLANGFWSRIKASFLTKKKEHERKIVEKEQKKKSKLIASPLDKESPGNYELFHDKASVFLKKNVQSVSSIMSDLKVAIGPIANKSTKSISFLSIKRSNQDLLFDIDSVMKSSDSAQNTLSMKKNVFNH